MTVFAAPRLEIEVVRQAAGAAATVVGTAVLVVSVVRGELVFAGDLGQ